MPVTVGVTEGPSVPSSRGRVLGTSSMVGSVPNTVSTTPGTAAAIECGTDRMGAPRVWNELGITGNGAVIAVIDSGIDLDHPELIGRLWVNDDEIPGNGIDDDSNGYIDDTWGWDFVNADSDPFDDNGHGTHLAGIVGAVGDNGIGIAGVNWDGSYNTDRHGGPGTAGCGQ